MGLKGTEWKQFASFQKSLLCRDTTGTAVTEQEIEAALHNRPLLVTIRYGPLFPDISNLLDTENGVS